MPEQHPPDESRAEEPGAPLAPEELARLAALHRSLEPADQVFEQPPPVVWDRIVEALDGVPTDAADAPARDAAGPAPLRRRALHRRRLLAAAAAVVAVAITAGALLLAGQDGPARTELASTTLTNAGLDPRGADASGTARLVRRGGDTYLDLRLTDPPASADGYLEVWLIAPDLDGMVSLGPFRGDGLYLVPDGVDPSRYPIVDVSDEPPDGQPTHSGISLLRGDLA